MIFNYGYGCFAFAHNVCGSQPEVPDGMSDTSKPLSPSLFTNPQCPPGIIHAEAAFIDVHLGEVTNAPEREALAVVLEIDNSEAGEHLSATEVRPGNKPDSFAIITGEINEPNVSREN